MNTKTSLAFCTAAVLASVAALSACVAPKDEISEFGKECSSSDDCGSGFVCDDTQTICVKSGDETQNEGRTITAFCAKRTTCAVNASPDCATSFQTSVSNAGSQGAQQCTQLHDAILAVMTCELDEDCTTFEQGGECPDEIATLNTLLDGGAAPCEQGNPPGPPVPAGWLCPAGYFGSGDGCDCGCGVLDDDCNGQGCAEPSCNQDDTCDFCYDAGQSQTDGAANDACTSG